MAKRKRELSIHEQRVALARKEDRKKTRLQKAASPVKLQAHPRPGR